MNATQNGELHCLWLFELIKKWTQRQTLAAGWVPLNSKTEARIVVCDCSAAVKPESDENDSNDKHNQLVLDKYTLLQHLFGLTFSISLKTTISRHIRLQHRMQG